VTTGHLRRSKFVHDTFESTDRRMKLADHVHDTHFNLPVSYQSKQGELPNPHVATQAAVTRNVQGSVHRREDALVRRKRPIPWFG